MRKLFFDTNVILSFHFADAKKREQKAIDYIFLKLKEKRWEAYISLITFYQLLYFIDKKVGSAKEAAKRAYAYLDLVKVAPFDPGLLGAMDIRYWPDYEDGLQYLCAQSANCEMIITSNSADFFASDIPVIDPLNFVLMSSSF